ncbi:exostosin domain-containing protein [Flavobacterium sp.]|uniref:exostosin domain-containing protein n=1 Tax=Flavobacterium sp. TaxID=239 RepID=UPI003D0BFA12
MNNVIKFFSEGYKLAEELFKNHPNYIETDINTADLIISSKIDTGEVNSKVIQNAISSYKNTRKIVLFILVSDNESFFKIPENVLLFRTSLRKSKRCKNEFLLPYLWECFDKPASPLLKSEKPIIGFCGNIKKNLGKRFSTIEAFKESDAIVSNFILRNDFWGGKPHDSTLKNDFYENLKNSHFTICNRGKGNFAIRFYQTLSLGRIPVLIDTDMEFPFEEEINWKNHIITGKNEFDLVLETQKFWNSHTEEEIIAIQNSNRNLFENYFTPNCFVDKISTIIYNKINTIDFDNKSHSFFDRILNKIRLNG